MQFLSIKNIMFLVLPLHNTSFFSKNQLENIKKCIINSEDILIIVFPSRTLQIQYHLNLHNGWYDLICFSSVKLPLRFICFNKSVAIIKTLWLKNILCLRMKHSWKRHITSSTRCSVFSICLELFKHMHEWAERWRGASLFIAKLLPFSFIKHFLFTVFLLLLFLMF